MAQLIRWRDSQDLAGRVHFLGHRHDVPAILPHLTCFWLGSAYEGQSNAVMEAMQAGVPVIATDIPGNRELIVPEETGFLYSVGDRATLARLTHRLLDDAALAERFSQRGPTASPGAFQCRGHGLAACRTLHATPGRCRAVARWLADQSI